MGEPLAYFLTWTTYGTWLPGDDRGWVNRHNRKVEVLEEPSESLFSHAWALLKASPLKLDQRMRSVVEQSVSETCEELQWELRVVRVLTTHVHVVLAAPQVPPGKVMGLLKADATSQLRCLPDMQERTKWWTSRGSKRLLYTEEAVAAALKYVFDQEHSWKKKR